MSNKIVEISVVVPFYNEELTIVFFCNTLKSELNKLKLDYEVILVDDGSNDKSVDLLKKVEWSQARLCRLSRNYGHQIAITAGLEFAKGRYVVTMDSDLQHPPHLIQHLYETIDKSKVDVVHAVRNDKVSSFFKKLLSRSYYRIVSLIAGVNVLKDIGDFRIMTNDVVHKILEIRGDKTLRLLIPFYNFTYKLVEYELPERYAGESKFTFKKMLFMAAKSLLYFSSRPLLFISISSLFILLASLIWLLFIFMSYFTNETIEGWPSVAALITFFGSLNIFFLSLLSIYVAKIYELISKKPLFILKSYSTL